MALVALVKGINVGGHRRFRPSILAKELKHFGVVNVGAAGTFVARGATSREDLRAEITRRLPFEATVAICTGRDILRLEVSRPFADQAPRPEVVQFISTLTEPRMPPSPVQFDLPAQGNWCVRVLDCKGQFVVGLHRRQMRAIRYLGQLEEILGVPLTTRSWSTIMTIARLLRS